MKKKSSTKSQTHLFFSALSRQQQIKEVSFAFDDDNDVDEREINLKLKYGKIITKKLIPHETNLKETKIKFFCS